MACAGNSADHCCYINGEPCPHLRDDGPDATRRWVCTLREELGSWDAVHVDPRYLRDVQPFWNGYAPTLGCGDWPVKRQTCEVCGVTNDG